MRLFRAALAAASNSDCNNKRRGALQLLRAKPVRQDAAGLQSAAAAEPASSELTARRRPLAAQDGRNHANADAQLRCAARGTAAASGAVLPTPAKVSVCLHVCRLHSLLTIY